MSSEEEGVCQMSGGNQQHVNSIKPILFVESGRRSGEPKQSAHRRAESSEGDVL
jgi:hypothetical protein